MDWLEMEAAALIVAATFVGVTGALAGRYRLVDNSIVFIFGIGATFMFIHTMGW